MGTNNRLGRDLESTSNIDDFASRGPQRPSEKLRILHSLPSVNPTSGGVVEGVRQIVTALHALGFRTEIVSGDRPTDPWVTNFPVKVNALGPSPLPFKYGLIPSLPRWIAENASRFDLVILDGVWQFSSFGAWLGLRRTNTPYLVFAHGMLDDRFKRRYPLKHLKKWLYWPWAEHRVLSGAAAVVFTSDKERIRARESFALYRVRERVVNYGISDPQIAEGASALFQGAFPQVKGHRVVLFLGRIHRIKACDILIRAFAAVARQQPNLMLVIAGPDVSGWASTLAELSATLGVAKQVFWTGPLYGELKWGALLTADTLCQPSYQESFGLSVVEALACSLPVLLSTGVDIHEEITRDGAGFAEEPTVAGMERMLNRWLETSEAERLAMRQNARRCFLSRFEARAVAESFLSVYNEAVSLAAKERPAVPSR